MHQVTHKVSSHVHSFFKQLAQSQKSFNKDGPWQVIPSSNAKLEAKARQSHMEGTKLFQAVYILSQNESVASVSSALPQPHELVAEKPVVVVKAAGEALSVSGATGRTKAVAIKVECKHCGELFGVQGLKNHENSLVEMVHFWKHILWLEKVD